MIVIAKDRQEGKTTALVEWVKEGRVIRTFPYVTRVLVVSFARERENIMRVHGLSGHQVVEFATLRRQPHRYMDTEIGVDNAEYLLEWALGLHGNIKALTVNTGVRGGD